MSKEDNRLRRGRKRQRRRKRETPRGRGGSDPGYQADNAERFPHPEDGQQAVKEAREQVERLEDES